MRSLKLVKDVVYCKNRICFCVEYLNFSKPNHFVIYNECYKIKRNNISKLLVSPKMMSYLNSPLKVYEDYDRR